MDFISVLYVVFLAIYAVIIGLVAPYVGIKSENYGSFVPTAIALITGALLWIIGTWVGLHYDQPWIWMIVMLLMPVGMWFGCGALDALREAGKLDGFKLSGKAESIHADGVSAD